MAPAPFVATPPATAVAAPKGSSKLALAAGIGGGVGVLLLSIVIALCIWRVRHRSKRSSMVGSSSKGAPV